MKALTTFWRCAWSVTLLMGGLAASAAAQKVDHASADADSLIASALERARAGDTAAALRVLERATQVAPEYARGYFERGLLLSRATQLGMSDILRRREASREINRALDLDRDNPFYLMELGRIRLKTPFLRLDAERLFNKALHAAEARRDPRVLAEVHWELGQIHERRFATTAHRQLLTGASPSFDVDRASSDWRYTRDFLTLFSSPIPDAGELDFRQAEDHFRAALLADPAHEGAGLALLGLLADARRYEEMLRLARDLQRAVPSSPRVLMATGFALHHVGRDAEAEAIFDRALTLIPTFERREMLGLASVLRSEAAADYDKLSETERASFDTLYWDVADPLTLTAVNEARVEFFSRVAYADLRFTSPEFRQYGWRTDRGIIHIRYGEPTQIASIAPETQDTDNSESMGRVTTIWYYPADKRQFVFVGPPAMNYSRFAGDFRAYAENVRYVSPVHFAATGAAEPDSVPVQLARFRADSSRAVDVLVFADVPTARLFGDVDVTRATLETGFFLNDTRNRRIVSRRDSAVVRNDSHDRVTSRTWREQLAPGSYIYRVEARQAASGHSARGLSPFDINAFPTAELSSSDILVARHLAMRNGITTPRGRGDLLITPNASLTFAPGDTVFLYWENYGVAHDSSGSGHLRVELSLRVEAIDRGQSVGARILGGVADAIGVTAKGDDRVSLRYDRTVAVNGSDRVANHLALDLGDSPYGTYLVNLAVTDLTSGHTTNQQRTITVPRP